MSPSAESAGENALPVSCAPTAQQGAIRAPSYLFWSLALDSWRYDDQCNVTSSLLDDATDMTLTLVRKSAFVFKNQARSTDA